ncbi:MAG: hypothetical protein HY819_05270 [Acidobacteria bacterium]|nr:hypothetical protein [Acidobacteriota bacterium]
MGKIKKIDEFIVSIEDSTTLLKLYLQRVARSPGNATYCRALATHAGEIRYAAETLYINLTHELASLTKPLAIATVNYVEYLMELANLIDQLALDMASGQAFDLVSAIDLLRDGVDKLEQLIQIISQGQIVNAKAIAQTIKTFQEILEGEVSFVDDVISRTAEHPVPEASTEDNELNFEEEDPFDELEIDNELLDEIVNGLDDSVDSVIEEQATLKTAISGEADYLLEINTKQLKELFANLISSYAQPIKGFIKELRDGFASKEWITICSQALELIDNAAFSMDYEDLSLAVSNFSSLLKSVKESPERLISGENKKEILTSYTYLVLCLPQAFSLEDDIINIISSREGLIIQSLLKQVKQVGTTTVRKLFAAGLTTLEQYYQAKPSELVLLANIRPWLAERICQQFQQHLRDNKDNKEPNKVTYKKKLKLLVEELKRQQFLFKKATLEDWYSQQDSEQKKQRRRNRQKVMWQINAVLAEEGTAVSMALLKELKKLVFERRIERLEAYLVNM